MTTCIRVFGVEPILLAFKPRVYALQACRDTRLFIALYTPVAQGRMPQVALPITAATSIVVVVMNLLLAQVAHLARNLLLRNECLHNTLGRHSVCLGGGSPYSWSAQIRFEELPSSTSTK